MKQVNWLSKNVRSIIGLMIVVYALNFFSLVLILGLGNAQLVDRMETSLNNLVMFVLGYYFSANHHPQPSETKTETTEKTTQSGKTL